MYCRKGQYGQCLGGGGWMFGHLVDGLQAEYARVPFADTSVYKLPEEVTDEQVVYLADILPTGYEVGVRNGGVSPGDTVAIVGAGPIGLSAILGSRLYSPERIVVIEPTEARRAKALEFGADVTFAPEEAVDAVLGLTDGLGADVVMEAVGVRVVDTVSTPTLLRLIKAGRLDPSVFTTHRFGLDEAMLAYDTFAAAGDTGALKVLMTTA